MLRGKLLLIYPWTFQIFQCDLPQNLPQQSLQNTEPETASAMSVQSSRQDRGLQRMKWYALGIKKHCKGDVSEI